jgi:hypothetical protein
MASFAVIGEDILNVFSTSYCIDGKFLRYSCSYVFFRVFVVKLKPQQNIQQLPSPEQNPVFSYEYVHHEANGGTYIADVFDK